jgi:hypothetical protein
MYARYFHGNEASTLNDFRTPVSMKGRGEKRSLGPFSSHNRPEAFGDEASVQRSVVARAFLFRSDLARENGMKMQWRAR